MKVSVKFLGGSSYWQDLVSESARKASRVLSDPTFIQKIAEWPVFDFTTATSQMVADRIRDTLEIDISVGFYYKIFTRAIAYEQNNAVYFNTRKESYGAGSVGNVVHETMHALGYAHNGNAAAGNENTVPYRLGEWASTWIIPDIGPITLTEPTEPPASLLAMTITNLTSD